MAKFHELSAVVDAEQYIFGKLPALSVAGRTAVPYARENVLPTALCAVCHTPMSQHAWIAPPPPPVDPNLAALPVDPVTGETVAPAPVPDLPPNSKLYAKPGAPNQVIPDSDTAAISAATADGFTAVAAPVAAPPPGPTGPAPQVMEKQGQSNRTVTNAKEYDDAVAAGFTPVKAQFPASSVHAGVARAPGPKPIAPVLDDKRGDLQGLVLHPKWWLVVRKSGEALAVPPDNQANAPAGFTIDRS